MSQDLGSTTSLSTSLYTEGMHMGQGMGTCLWAQITLPTMKTAITLHAYPILAKLAHQAGWAGLSARLSNAAPPA